MRSPSCSVTSGRKRLLARAVGADGRPMMGAGMAGEQDHGLQRRGTRRVIGVGMGAHDVADIAAGGIVQALQMFGIVRSGVDGDIAGVRIADQIAVGAGAGHHAGVGAVRRIRFLRSGTAFKLPVEMVGGLAVGWTISSSP